MSGPPASATQGLTRAVGVLRTVEVDLTPVLPGGDNGGAKTFAVELVRRLIYLQPECRFILLTSELTHEELSILDGPNAERHLVRPGGALRAGRANPPVLHAALSLLPHRLRRLLAQSVIRLRQKAMRVFRRSLPTSDLPDLLFCPFTATTYVKAGVPAVSVLHDLQYRTYPEFFTPEEQAHRDAVFRSACRDASCLIAISEYTRSEALASGSIEVDRIHVVPHRLAGRLAGGSQTTRIADIPQAPYILYPANFWRHKNHEMLLTGFGMAIRQGLPSDVTLVFTGAPGEREAAIRRLCEAMGLQSRVVFAGHLPEPDFADILASADALVFPSLFEGFGMPVLEAMALGVPVAASRLTALAEVCGDAALMFDPRVPHQISAALVSIATDQPLRQQLSAHGRARAREFSDADGMARAYWRIFEESVARGAVRNRFHGAHADGWLSGTASLEVSLPDGIDAADLVLELEAPSWIPAPGPTLTVACPGSRSESIVLAPGTSTRWQTKTSGGRMTFSISPSFVPSRLGVSKDDRELTVLLRACRIEGVGVEPCILWPVSEC